jgi:hypothetical protein
MAGAQDRGHGRDLGGPVIFRSRIGVSRLLHERVRIGLQFEHKSNAGLDDGNPGVETLFVSLGASF